MKPFVTIMHSAYDWGEEFRDEAWETVRRIKEFPQAWHPLSGSIRRCQMRRFPFGVIYEPSELEIVIIAIAHLHREPEYWRARIQ